jgi:hypothetical protein
MLKINYLLSSMLAGISALFVASASADNSVIVEQVGGAGGSVNVKQSGEGNSVRISQGGLSINDNTDNDYDAVDGKKSKNSANNLSSLSVGERARANSIINQHNSAENKPIVNSIVVEQNGTNNSSTLSQTGNANQLLLKQEGKNNSYSKSQIGDYNKTKVMQNGKITEEIGE